MKTLKQQVLELANRRPSDVKDDDDDFNSTIIGSEFPDEDFDERLATPSLHLRGELADPGKKYSGKKSSRKAIFKDSSEEETLDEEVSEDIDTSQNKKSKHQDDLEAQASSDEDQDEDYDIENGAVTKFTTSVLEEADQLQEELEKTQKKHSTMSQLMTESRLQQEKGQHTLQQLKMWERVLDIRIGQQKLLTEVNQFPQKEDYQVFCQNSNLKTNFEDVAEELKSLLSDMIQLQKELFNHSSDFKSKYSSFSKCNDGQNHLKRKRWEDIDLLTQTVKLCGESIISKWSERTNLWSNNSAKLTTTGASLKAFNISINQQIEKLIDEPRVLKRTQLLRSSNRIFGKKQKIGSSGSQNGTSLSELAPQNSENDLKYSEEIYDDTDFYQFLLKDLIDNYTTDSLTMGKRWEEVRDLNSKIKANTRAIEKHANKGRKLRFNVHQKLFNFMTMVPPDESDMSFAKSLFENLFL